MKAPAKTISFHMEDNAVTNIITKILIFLSILHAKPTQPTLLINFWFSLLLYKTKSVIKGSILFPNNLLIQTLFYFTDVLDFLNFLALHLSSAY